ncbi:hypothetical protein [Haloechinothrix halophila]|uniref:hypothetical protein n=1 Tax=Haloechinothrix halophila TaxID=1069073 RepID=UPI00054DF390|nr:hypothetical protein [Haloechinothrix halophila]
MTAATAPTLPPTARWMATEPMSVGVFHLGRTNAQWVPSTGPCTGGMGGSGGWPTLCGLIALPLWREVGADEIDWRGTCPDCWEANE